MILKIEFLQYSDFLLLQIVEMMNFNHLMDFISFPFFVSLYETFIFMTHSLKLIVMVFDCVMI